MRDDGALKKISFVAISNIFKLISSILIAFIIPKILGLTNYGYYKIFGLYLTYIGLFHFGFIDGIYIKYGGIDYEKLERKQFRTFFRFLLSFELTIGILGVLVSIFFIQAEKQIIFILLFLNLIAINLTTYYQFISQITSRFKEYSLRIIFLSFTNIIIVAILYYLHISDYRIYITLIVLINYVLLFWYIYTYKDITFGKKLSLKESRHAITELFKIGIPLLLANLSTTFVITVDKQIVEILFPVEIFGVYSFAYSMLSMITVVVSAISVVLYPTLKRTNFDNISNNYYKLNKVIIIIVLIGLIAYFPLLWLIPKFLPEYVDSLIIFRIAMPGLVFTSSISAIKHNFFKITNKNIQFFFLGLGSIITNIVLNLLSYNIFGTTTAIAVSSVFGLVIWYIATEIFMIKNFSVKWKSNALLASIGILIFYLFTSIQNYLISGALYSLLIIIFLIINGKKVLILLNIKI